MTNSGPGYKKHPEHRLSAKPAGARLQVTLNGEVIADSADAIRLEEGTYPAVYYFPRKDVRMELLERSTHETYCPFKGTASYYSFKDGAKNAAWTVRPSARKRPATPRWSRSSIVRAWNPPAREPTSSGVGRRSTTVTPAPARASSAASTIPVGPPPAMSTSNMTTSFRPVFPGTSEKFEACRGPCRKAPWAR